MIDNDPVESEGCLVDFGVTFVADARPIRDIGKKSWRHAGSMGGRLPGQL